MMNAVENGDVSAVFPILKPLADRGNTRAQHLLGHVYAKVCNKYEISSDWSAYNFYSSESFKWCYQSAMQGYSIAQLSIGEFYKLGFGVKQDLVLAYMWNYLAELSGNDVAGYLRKLLSNNLTASQIKQAERLACEWILAKE